MNQKYNPALRIISTIVLSFFLWMFGGVFEVAYAIKDRDGLSVKSDERKKNQSPVPNPQTPREKRSEEKFSKAIEDVENILKDDKTDHETKKQRIKAKKAEIDSHDIEIRKQFIETEGKIKDLPEIIKKRHRDFVKHYDDNLRELKANIDDIDKAKTDTEREHAHRKAKAHLEKVKAPKKHKTLDPNKLPHRTEEPVFKEPRTKPEEFIEDHNALAVMGNGLKNFNYSSRVTHHASPLLVAANGTLDGLLSANTQYNTKSIDLLPDGSYQIALATPPTSADLAENGIEIVFTPAITAKAAELGYKPVKIYEWVRNNIEYVPTYGSIQGADMCLQTKLCNDMDTASLLIALLRVSGIHARYVYGTIELPIDKVKNWAGGFTDTMSALGLFASAGVPTKGMTVGGEIKYARLEHTWVEAYIDYIPSRGSRHKTGEGDTWIPLDASFKQYTYTQGIDIKTAVPFDAQTFVDQIKTTATINEAQGYVTGVNSLLVQQTMQNYQSRIQSYISQNYPNATVGDVLGKKEIVKQEFPYLLGTLPYKPLIKGATYSSIPDSKRHKITFEVFKDANDELLGTKLIITKSLPELAGKRISLNYVPATQADKTILDNYSNAASVPAYLVHLKAELKFDNTVIANGPSTTMGTDQTLNLTFISPTISETETHLLIAGDQSVIGLNIGGAASVFEKRVSQSDGNDRVSEMLHQTILAYWAEYDVLKEITSKKYGVVSVRLPSEGLSSAPISIKYIFGIPLSGSYSGRGLDVKRDLDVISSQDGEKEPIIEFNQAAGVIGSLFEGLIFDQLFKNAAGNGLSTITILNIANSQRIPIYYITESNLNNILQNLQVSNDVISDIKNAISAGKEVVVPQANITQGGWSGTGYIIIDANTGNGSYLISGGAAGGIFEYAADLLAAVAVEETPFTPGILNAVTTWMAFVRTPATEEIMKQIGIDMAKKLQEVKPPGAELQALKCLRIVMLAALIALAIDTIVDTKVDENYQEFRHYTDEAGREGILQSGVIWATEGGDLGTGAYVTDFMAVEPDTYDHRKLICRYINRQPLSECPDFITTYVKIFIDRSRILLLQGSQDKDELKHQYMYPLGPLKEDKSSVIFVR